MTKNKLILFTSFLITSFISEAREKVLLTADMWCPYNCAPNSDREGILIDIARKAFDKINMDVDYQIRPWNQDVNDFNNGKIDGIIGTTQDEVKDAILPSIPQALNMISAYTLTGKDWKYHGAASLDNKVLGLVKDYPYGDVVSKYIAANSPKNPQNYIYSQSDNAISDNVNKLENGTTFVYFEDNNVINDYLVTNKITNIRNAGSILKKPLKIYIAFPKQKSRSQEFAKLMSDTTKELKENGKYEVLVKKYNMKIY